MSPASVALNYREIARPASCPRCGGFLSDWFDGDWLCAMCGCVVYHAVAVG